MKLIPDCPGFDRRLHNYIVTTGGGDSWEASPPIGQALLSDALVAYSDELPNDFTWEDWITFPLAVVRNDTDEELATFDIEQMRWIPTT